METNATKICIPVCATRASDLPGMLARASKIADIVELRLDYLDRAELDLARRTLPEQLRQVRVPAILTLRSPDQGGHTSQDLEARHDFWSSLGGVPENCFVDLELNLVLRFAAAESELRLPFDWSQVICSHHDFAATPEDIEEIYQRMAATPARILKIAVQANDANDCLPVFRLLERAQREGREMIAIAMGHAGIMTRVLGPSRGSFLTYASLDDENATAPGQLTARELREIYRMDRIDRQTEIFGTVGQPIAHSLSPQIHNAAFAAAEVNAVYLPFEVHDALQFMRRMIHPRSREIEWKLRGLSVTAPHKSTVMKCLDWIEPAAKEIGAVNTVVVSDHELHGDNTDAAGFISPLRDAFGSLENARCAIIGAGGAARAVLSALQKEKARVVLFARDVLKTKPLADEFGGECRPLADARFDGFDVVVNATPVGTRGDRENETPAVAEQLRGVRLAYDLVYNPLETRFLREARAAGCATLSGLEMLIAQAVEQFKLWTGKQPDVRVMRNAAVNALSSESNTE